MRYGVQRRFDENICVIVQQFYMKQSSSAQIFKFNMYIQAKCETYE